VPEGWPVADHEQLPMFPQDPAEFARIAREQAETARVQAETARVQSETALLAYRAAVDMSRDAQALIRLVLDKVNGRDATHDSPATTTEVTTGTQPDHAGYGPSNPKHRTWRGFCLDMQRQVRELPSGTKPSKTNVASHGVDTVRAINYAMEGYGLPLTDWPPDHWDPDEDRPWRSPRHK